MTVTKKEFAVNALHIIEKEKNCLLVTLMRRQKKVMIEVLTLILK